MKKRNLLMLLMVLVVCIRGTALAADDFSIPSIQNAEGHSETIRSIAIGDTVYLLSAGRNLYTLDAEKQQVTPVPMHNANPEYEQIPESALDFHEIPRNEAAPDWLKRYATLIDMLSWDGEALYGVNELNGALYRLDVTGDGATLHAIAKLDFFSGIEKECMPSLSSGVACDGSLYLMMCLAADEGWPSLYLFDMATGAREPVKGQGRIAEVAQYRDGQLLLLEKRSDSQWQITGFDTATQARTILWESDRINIENVLGLLYDPWRDRVLIQAGNELLTFVSETACGVVAYLPPFEFDFRALAENGLLMLTHDQSVYALSTLPEKQLKPLQVACNDLE